MHSAAYRALGLPHTYEAIRAQGSDLSTLVQKLREGAYDGFNVTVPHKRAVLALADEVAASAQAVGAANTLVRGASGEIVAHNTDVPALAHELSRLAPEMAQKPWRSALVLGSGGAARSAVVALAVNLGVPQITVRARSQSDASVVPPGVDPRRIEIEPLEPLGGDFDAVVQATSAGMTGADAGDAIADAVPWNTLPTHAVAIDLVYAPPETPFLRAAAARRLRCANGLGMLARQGALAFELWLGIRAPFEIMLAALEDNLRT